MKSIFILTLLSAAFSKLSTAQGETYKRTINPEIVPFYFGESSYYYMSTFQADIDTAKKECGELNNFKLVSLEDENELNSLLEHIKIKDIPLPIWTSGYLKTDNGSESEPSLVWTSTLEPISFPNFSKSNLTKVDRRRKRELHCSNECPTAPPPTNIPCTQKPIECKSPVCNVTWPPCETKIPDCKVSKPECSVADQVCQATCPPCKIEQGKCSLKQFPCTATPGKCTIDDSDCTVVQRNCTTVRPDCIQKKVNCTVPPVEDLCTPAPTTPCTTRQPCVTTQAPCKEVCTTTTPPCYEEPQPCTGGKNKRSVETDGLNKGLTCPPSVITCPNKTTTCGTVCPPPKTTCKPIFDCRPIAWVCMTPAVICDNPDIEYCPPAVTTCTSPKTECGEPKIHCEQATAYCPEPEVICEPAKVVCPGAEIGCSSPIAHCSQPNFTCPDVEVTCGKPIIECEPQKPCEISPPDCSGSSTTPKPCNKCKRSTKPTLNPGCISISTQDESRWQVENCSKEHYFICESNDRIR